MKKAISLFLAATVLCLSTSAFAAIGTDNVQKNGNSVSTLDTTYGGTNGRGVPMPGFSPGDTISFRVTGLTAGEELTLITYKYGTSPSDSTVQYINQYTTTGSTQTVSYTIRSNQTAGIYKVTITGSTSGTRTFYYKIGTVTVSMVDPVGEPAGTPYTSVKYPDGTYSIGFIGKATTDSTDINISELATNVGFTLNGGKFTDGYNYSVSASTLDTYFNSLISGGTLEINGSYSVLYGLTVWKIPDGTQNSITASAYKN